MRDRFIKRLIGKRGYRLWQQVCESDLTAQHHHYRVIQSIDFQEHKYEEQCLEKKESYKIAFIVEEMWGHSGGITSILRLGTYLTQFGHHVYYVDLSGRPVKESAENAKNNLPYYQGELIGEEGLNDEYDIGVATAWLTAYYLYGRDNFSYKCYFIQDFEPAFFPLGDLYHLTLNTYKFNFHMISLGPWNASQIRKHIGKAETSVIDFPVEIEQFPIQKRKINVTDRLKLIVYVKPASRRAPVLVFQSLDLLTRVLADRQMTVQVLVFGLDPRAEIPIGTNAGYVPHNELLEYYRTSDFGVVASFSNISLITCEMIASGLPVIEFKDGSAPTFFDKRQLIFCETSPADFVSKVLYYLDHQEELNKMVVNAQDSLRDKTWERSARSFIAAITSTQN